MPPKPLSLKIRGGGGLGGVAYKDRGRPPPPPPHASRASLRNTTSLFCVFQFGQPEVLGGKIMSVKSSGARISLGPRPCFNHQNSGHRQMTSALTLVRQTIIGDLLQPHWGLKG